MSKTEALQAEIDCFAAAIVDLVEKKNGPILLTELGEKISGFAMSPRQGYEYFISHKQGETVVWDGMTEAGYKALRNVLNTRRIAIQYVRMLPYLLAGTISSSEHWQPFVRMPARAANFDTPIWAFRVSPMMQTAMMIEAAATGTPANDPGPVRFTADEFSY